MQLTQACNSGLKHPLYDRRVDVSKPLFHHKSQNISWMYLNKSKNKSHCSDFETATLNSFSLAVQYATLYCYPELNVLLFQAC